MKMIGDKYATHLKNNATNSKLSYQPLQDILNTCKLSKEVIQVLPIQTELFNTILTTRLKTGKIRTHYYNRLDLGQILKGIVVRGTSTTDVIHELNTEQYCDFTEDDVEIIGKELVAKVDSLGYIGRHSLNGSEPSTGDNGNQEDQEPVPTNRVHIIPDLFYGYWEEEVTISTISWQLEIDGVLQDVILTTESPSVHIEDWLIENYPMDYSSQQLEEGGVVGQELRKRSFGRADFRLIPSENPLPIIEKHALVEMYDASNNPTFNTDEDGIITFSLMGPPEPPLPDLNNLVLRASGGEWGDDVYISNMYLFGEDGVDDLTISAEVDWGDGSPKETYVGYDIYDIYRYFEPWEQYYVSIKFNKTVPMFHISGDAIVEVMSFGLNPITNLRFDYAGSLVKLPEYLPPFMTSLERMFEDCGILNCPNISKWDVSHVTNFTSTFRDAYSFNRSLNDWDMSSAVTLETMFYNANSFNQPLNKWNISNVKSLKLTFGQAYLFNQNINDWDTSNVENMWGVFYQTHNFNQPLDKWNTSKVTDMHGTFQETRAFNQDIGMWVVDKVVDMTWMFYRAQVFNQDLSQWCVPSLGWPESFDAQASVWTLPRPVWGTCPSGIKDTMQFTTMSGSLTYQGSPGDVIELSDGSRKIINNTNETSYSVPLGTHTVKLMGARSSNEVKLYGPALSTVNTFPVIDSINKVTFAGSSNLIQVPATLPKNLTDCSYMFLGCSGFNYNISGWDVSHVTNMHRMFSQATNFNQPIGSWNISNVTDISFMLHWAEAFNQNVNDWDVSNKTSLESLFHLNRVFNQPLDKWNVSNVTNLQNTFGSAYMFNQDISMWDVSNVTDFTNTFGGAHAFNKPLNSWNVGKGTSFKGTFGAAQAFNQPLDNWDVSNATNMSGMFNTAYAFNQPLNSWDVSTVTDMAYMFGTTNAFNQPLNNWNVANVTSMTGMFSYAKAFTQNLSQWCVAFIAVEPQEFGYQAAAFTYPVWGTCPVKLGVDEIPSDEMHFTTLAGSVDYLGTQGDQILLSDGTTVDVTSTNTTFTFNVPSGKLKVKLVESADRSNYVSVGGGALVELHNFPTLSTVTKFNFSTYNYNPLPNLTKVPDFLPSNIVDCTDMFTKAISFNQDIGMWDVSNVNTMNAMFAQARAFNQDISMWDTSEVTSMHSMFGEASAFNQDLSQWCVPHVTYMPSGFNTGAPLLVGAKLPVWGTCPRGENLV